MLGIMVGVSNSSIDGGEAPSVLITTDSTQHTIDTTTLYTIDNNNTTI